jgi:acyl dehydratase
MDLIATVSIAAALAWGSGLRLYAVLFVSGLLARFGYLELPGELVLLAHPLVLTASGIMLVVEFLADKVPGLDTLWDTVHTFIRIPAGAVLAAAALGAHDPAIVLAAGILGGMLASGTHFAKAGGRALINASPEPVSNMTASTAEDVLVVAGLWTAFAHPLAFLAFLALFVLLLVWLLPKLWRGLKSVFAKVAALLGGRDPLSWSR